MKRYGLFTLLEKQLASVSKSAKLTGQISLLGCGAVLAACSGDQDDSDPDPIDPPPVDQPSDAALKMGAYRIRTDASTDLNSDSWAGEVNTTTEVEVDHPFRLRVEVENSVATPADHTFSMEYRINGGSWSTLTDEDFPYPEKEVVLDFSEPPADASTVPFNLVTGAQDNFAFEAIDDEGFLRVTSADTPVLATGDYFTYWEPIEYKAVVRIGESAQAGVVFGYQDENNFYSLNMVAGGGLSISQYRDGQESVIQQMGFDVEVKFDQWIEVAVVVEGTEVTVEYEWDPIIEGVEWSGELAEAPPASVIGLMVPAQNSVDVLEMETSTDAQSPLVSIVSSEAYSNGAATTDLLEGSQLPFVTGAGVSFAPVTPTWSAANSHTEWEFAMVLRYFADGAQNTLDGDLFEFRLLDETGTPLVADSYPTVEASVPEGHLGGTFVETPARLGPWQAEDGSLYFLMEPSETDNLMMIVKSTDGGESWLEVDGTHRPMTGDLEGVSTTFDGENVHILHQTSDDVLYHRFRTSAHENADTWEITDEVLASPSEPPVQVSDLALRSDGSIVGVYGDLHKVLFQVRSSTGEWGEATVIDPDVARDLSGPTVVTGKDDVVHLAYTGFDGTAWYRRILPSGELTPAQQVAEGLGTETDDAGGILPLTYSESTDSLSIIYRLANGELWEKQVNSEDELSEAVQVTSFTVVTNAADSEQAGADAIAFESQMHVLFIEEDSGRLFRVSRDADSAWSEPELIIDGEDVLWVRGALIEHDDDEYSYGFVYDGGSGGGSGFNRYVELPLESN